MFPLGVRKFGTADADPAAAHVAITPAALATTSALKHLLPVVMPLPSESFAATVERKNRKAVRINCADSRRVRETESVPKLLTTREAAERLSVSVFTVRNLAEFGALPVVRFTPTSRMRFRPEDVERLLESRLRREELK